MINKKEFHESLENPEAVQLKINELFEEISEISDIKKHISLLGQIGVHQRTLMLLDEAEITLQKVLELIAKNNLSIAFKVQNEIRLAHVYQWQKKFEVSNALFKDVINVCLNNKEASHYLAFAYQHHGKNLFDQDQFQEANDLFEKALSLRVANKVPRDQIESTEHALTVVKKYLDRRL